MEHVVRVRIRGIYATALTQLMLDKGFQIVQASQVIAERFNIPQLGLPADVTLKNSDQEPSELLIVGYQWAAGRVLEVLREELPYSFYWVSKLPLHATVKAEVLGSTGEMCKVRVAGIEAELTPPEACREAEAIVAGVVRPGVKPGERPRLRPGPRVIGDYAIVYKPWGEKPRTTLSEHIRNSVKKAELLAIAAPYVEKGYSIHWRSSSRFADAETLRRELEELIARLEEVEAKASQGPPGVYSEGETVALVRLSRPDKEKLDTLRARTVPTAPWHHSVKSTAPHLSDVIDYAEKLIPYGVDGGKLLNGLLDLLAEKLAQSKTVELVHVKPNGREIRIGPARVASIEKSGARLIITLERYVRSRGVYDGLEVEKEPGDRIVTEIDTDEWTIIHKYYGRDGTYKGAYININTPAEIGEATITYLDLEADVVKLPDGTRKIIDLEEAKKALEAGIITEKLYKRIEEIAAQHTRKS